MAREKAHWGSKVSESLSLAAEIAKPFEGLRLSAYHDPVGYPTIGYGHLLGRAPWDDLARWPDITDLEAEELLEKDMSRAARSVERLIQVFLEPEQEAALIDFAFNCGAGNLQASTLRRVINREEYEEAPAQFRRWVYARDQRLPGLVLRREAETEIWLSA